MELIFATHNEHKAEEVQQMLPDGFTVIDLKTKGFQDDIIENGDSFMANAEIKSETIFQKYQQAVFADDSGLVVEALDGAPGIYSARYAGTGNAEDNNKKLLDELDGEENRKAYFISVFCYIDSKGEKHFFEGKVHGKIALEAFGGGGFGYDPLFIPDGYNITFAEMKPEEKNNISHRRRALDTFLTILGYNSAIPTADSHPTSQLLEIGGKLILIDCGEGTQVQLRKAKAKFSRIDHIFISHMHGDHIFGLVGMISTFQLLGRTKPMHIFGPEGIKNFIENQLEHTRAYPTFPLDFKELESLESELILETKNFTVQTIPLSHRIYTNGYLFKEKPKPRKLNVEAVKSQSEIDICDYENLKAGKDFVLKNGNIIANEELTLDPEPPKSYAFMSDTMYQPSAIPIIEE
ncbi:unnamed protein product, partial [Cyprideis torosa]